MILSCKFLLLKVDIIFICPSPRPISFCFIILCCHQICLLEYISNPREVGFSEEIILFRMDSPLESHARLVSSGFKYYNPTRGPSQKNLSVHTQIWDSPPDPPKTETALKPKPPFRCKSSRLTQIPFVANGFLHNIISPEHNERRCSLAELILWYAAGGGGSNSTYPRPTLIDRQRANLATTVPRMGMRGSLTARIPVLYGNQSWGCMKGEGLRCYVVW